MAQTDALKKYLDAGMAFTALTRARAEQVVKDLVAAGELQRSQAKGAIDELLERSKKNGETLAEQVRKEVDSQLASLGLVRRGDLERLEAELAELKGTPAKKEAPGAEKKAEKKAPEAVRKPAEVEKAAAKEAPAKKASGSSAETGPSSELPATKAGGGERKTAPAKKAASSGAAPISNELPAKKAAGGGSRSSSAKKADSAKKQESQLSSLEKGDDQAGVGASPAKRSAKKQG